jgi:hypothetical protein
VGGREVAEDRVGGPTFCRISRVTTGTLDQGTGKVKDNTYWVSGGIVTSDAPDAPYRPSSQIDGRWSGCMFRKWLRPAFKSDKRWLRRIRREPDVCITRVNV